MKRKITETFTSIQGEGHLAGTKMFFIRFAGCTVSECPLHPRHSNLCDTDWSPKIVIEDIGTLVDMAEAEVGVDGWVSVTGGEPFDQFEFLSDLVRELHSRNLNINLQTSGSRDIGDIQVDWLTVSPKGWPLKIDVGDELKVVYNGQGAEELNRYVEETWFEHYFLMPLWSSSTNELETAEAALRIGPPWRVTLQQHKYIGVR